MQIITRCDIKKPPQLRRFFYKIFDIYFPRRSATLFQSITFQIAAR